MSIMAKTPSGYKKIGSAYLGERPVDKVFNANGDVVYALQRELTGVPPLLFKGKEQSELLNYRIYGDTVDGESVGDRTGNLFDGVFLQGYWALADGVFTVSGKWICTKKIPCKANTDYTFTLGIKSRWYGIAWYDIDGNYIEFISSKIESQPTIFTATSPANAAFMGVDIAGIQVGDDPLDIHPSDVTDLMLVEGSTPLPYEPYGYKVPVTVEGKNLFDGEFLQGYWAIADGVFMVSGKWICTKKIPCKANTDYTFTLGIKSRWYGIAWYDIDGNYIEFISSKIESQPTIFTATSPANAAFMGVDIAGIQVGDDLLDIHPSDVTDLMLVEGSTPLPYEPYHAPVITPIYLPEPIKMVGDEAEYIDYAEQKLHRVRKNLFDSNQALNGTLGLLSLELPLRYGFPGTVGGDKKTYFLPVTPGEQYTISMSTPGDRLAICGYYNIVNPNEYTVENRLPSDIAILPVTQTTPPSTYTFTVPDNVVMVSIYYSLDTQPVQFQIEKGSTATTYEPYIENTDLDVTLPALPIIKGTNEMSVDTEVQPSRMDIKGRIKSLT